MFLWEMFSDDNYLSFSVKSYVESNKPLWNKNLEIMYCLSGEITFHMGDQRYALKEEEFFVFNPYEIHDFEEGKYLVISIFFDEGLLKLSHRKRYFCYSEDPDIAENHFDSIRMLCADMLLLNIQKEENRSYQICSNALQILAILDKYCAKEGTTVNEESDKMTLLLQEVIRYLDTTYMEPLTVEQIAEAVGLPERTLSYNFKKSFGATIMQYLKRLRLTHAYRDLMDTEHSIVQVALDNGFPNVNAFISVFKDFYDESPAKFRKESRSKSTFYNQEFVVDDDVQKLDALTKYSSMEHDDLKLLITGNCKQYIRERVDVRKNGAERKITWNNLFNVGWAKEALLAPVQAQIMKLQREIGFSYIHFHGLFDDDMQVCKRMPDGKLDFNFTYIDMLFDFLISQNLLLDIELSFIPADLAADQTEFFQHRSHPCAPMYMNDWIELVRAFMRHCINRYGIELVQQWRFELFSSKYAYYQTLSKEEYWLLYGLSYRAIKGLLPQAQYGLFIDLALSCGSRDDNMFEYIMPQAIEADMKPDFIALECFHGEYQYMKGDEVLSKTISQIDNPTPRTKNPDFLADKLEQLKEYTKVFGMEAVPIYLNTWNSSDWQEDQYHDAIYKPAFLMKNILDNEDVLDAFGYWTLSDLLEETRHKEDLFHGGFGLLTYNGIPKASYFTYYMLKKLGKILLKKGEGYYVTKEMGGIQVLLYNYSHEEFLSHYKNFSSGADVKKRPFISVQILLRNINNGNYEINTALLNKENGSAYDTWMKIGAPKELKVNQHHYIESVSRPTTTIKNAKITNNTFMIEQNVLPNEVYLIQIKKINVR